MALVSRAVAICVLVLVASATPAAAAKWRQVTGFGQPDSITLDVSLARMGNGVLNVGWSQGTRVLNTQVSPDGETVSGPHTVFTYEQAAGAVGLVGVIGTSSPSGGLRAFFSGLDGGKKPHDALLSTATSVDGVGWAVQPSAASNSKPGENAPVYSSGRIDGTYFWDGTPLSVWQDSSGAYYHVGTSDQDPDRRFGGFGSGPSVATESTTGLVGIAWNNGDTGQTQFFVVYPDLEFQPGDTFNAPGGNAPDHSHPVDLTNRSNGLAGLYVAYLRGTNPFDAQPTVWRLSAAHENKPLAMTGREGRYPGVAMSVQGRIWAFWAEGVYTGQKRRIFARRSDEEVNEFGETVEVKPPNGTNDGNVWALEGEGASNGSLDLVALIQKGASGDNVANYVTRVLPGITLEVKQLDSGKIQFKTFDAGDKLATKIKFAGDSKKTGDDGKVTFPPPNPGKYKAKASANGYTPTTKRVKVKTVEDPNI